MPITLEFTIDRKVALVDIGDGCAIELLGPALEGPAAKIVPSPSHPLLHIALATLDTRSAIEIVRQAGYSITVEPKNVDLNGLSVTNAFFRGPDGEIIEFFQVNQ
jgi:glyoxylase I family protein